jgi:chromosome segregation ATPase
MAVIAGLKQQVADLTIQLSSTASTIGQDQTIQDLRKANDKLVDRVKYLEQKHSKEVEKARTEISKMSNRLTTFDTDNRKLNRELAELKTAKELVDKKLVQANEELALQTNLRQRLRENHDNLWNEYQRAITRGDGFMKRIFELQGDLEREQGTKRELVAELHRLSTKISHYKAANMTAIPETSSGKHHESWNSEQSTENTAPSECGQTDKDHEPTKKI